MPVRHKVNLGVIGTAIAMNAYIGSLNYLSSGLTSLLITLSPALTALLAHFFLRDEALTWQKVSGVVIAFAGAALLLIYRETGLADLPLGDWRGYALVGLGVLVSAFSNIYGREKLKNEDSLEVSSIYLLSAAVACVPIALFSGGYHLESLRSSGILVLLYSGIFGGFATFLLNFFIIKHFSATAGSSNAYVSPVVTALLGALFLGELVTPVMVAGMVIIFIGLALIDRKAK